MNKLNARDLKKNFPAKIIRKFCSTARIKMSAALDAMIRDRRLYRSRNFCLRARALENLEFFMDRPAGRTGEKNGPFRDEYERAHAFRKKLEAIDQQTFIMLQDRILGEGLCGKALLENIMNFLGPDKRLCRLSEEGYDDLDLFFNGLIPEMPMPQETKPREEDMVFYQKTPIRIILEVIKRAGFESGDVFFDLGSGLGQVNIWINLLTAVKSTGVEFEPSFCSFAEKSAAALGLSNVSYINEDIRFADYRGGTVFFLYSPCTGEMLGELLGRLKDEAKSRRIRVFTYGPCTAEFSRQRWLLSGRSFSDQFGDFVSL